MACAFRTPHRIPAKRQNSPCDNLESAALNELVAQVVEQRPFKAWVLGSNPSELTIIINGLAAFQRNVPGVLPRGSLPRRRGRRAAFRQIAVSRYSCAL